MPSLRYGIDVLQFDKRLLTLDDHSLRTPDGYGPRDRDEAMALIDQVTRHLGRLDKVIMAHEDFEIFRKAFHGKPDMIIVGGIEFSPERVIGR